MMFPGIDIPTEKLSESWLEALHEVFSVHGFDLASEDDLPEPIKKQLRAFLRSQGGNEEVDIKAFWEFLKNRSFLLEKQLRAATPSYRKGLLAETPWEERLDEEVPLEMRDLLAFQKFQLQVVEEPRKNFRFMSCDDFFKAHLRPLIKTDDLESGLRALGDEDFQLMRLGLVGHIAELTTREDFLNKDELSYFLADFIAYFSSDEDFENRLDLRMSRSLQETLWFARRMKMTEGEISGFFKTSLKVAEKYTGKFRNADIAKHQNEEGGTEKSSPFEHFMSVTRLSFGALNGLEENSCLLGNDFLEQIKKRPDYLLEIGYTALLHDVIEDGDFTKTEVIEFLKEVGLSRELRRQVLVNLKLLNAKRSGVAGNIEVYVDEILESDNPVVLLVKYADIMHNNKSENKKKWTRNAQGETVGVGAEWEFKQRAYDKIIEKIAVDNPVHVRVEELKIVMTENPELLRFPGWCALLNNHHEKEIIIASLPENVQRKVKNLLAEFL